MRSEVNRRNIFSRRAFVIGGAKLTLLTGLVARLYYLQFTRGSEYATLSENNRVKLQLLTPERGLITDRNGILMAENKDNFRAFLEPEQFKRIPEIMAQIGQLLGKDYSYELEDLEAKRKKQPNQPLMLIAHLSWEQVARLEVHALELPGLFIDVGKLRYYPYGQMTSHIMGYVGDVPESDPNARQLARLPELKVGRKGVEKAYEEQLRGTPGIRHMEVNALGMSIQELAREASHPGQRLPLSIDMRLQDVTHRRLAQEKSASAVVMNIHTGEILALSSHPAFDSNLFSPVIPQTYWDELNADPLVPLLNKSIAGQYPPGSTFKMLVGMAALEAGDIHSYTRFYCPGHMRIGNRDFHCWKREGHGSVNFEEAVERSCDVYFYNVGLMVGFDKVAEMARRFGLGSRTGIEILGEQSGLMPDSNWKRSRYGREWQRGDTVNASIGQGYVLATPLQLAVMTARMANGGFAVTPTFQKLRRGEQRIFPKIDVRPEDLALALSGMNMVTNSPRGTAYWKRIMEPGFEMAGKTGTSQVKRLSKHIKNEDEEWRHRHHALFVGYAPVHDPQYAVAVVVEHGGGGSSSAAPVARDLMLACQEFMQETTQIVAPPPTATYNPAKPRPPASRLRSNPTPTPRPADVPEPSPEPEEEAG